MSDENNVVSFGSRRRPDPALVREFAATARRLQQERSTSTELVERMLRTTPHQDWAALADKPSMRNAGVLEKLANEISARLETSPQEALALSNLATTIAETLPFDSYPPVVLAQMRAQAWRDRAQALRYLAKYRETLEALDRAESHLAAFGTLMHDRAMVMYVRGNTLRDIGALDEALSLLIESRLIFEEHGDTRRYLYCGVMEASVYYRSGDFVAGRQRYSALLEVARDLNDRETEARLHNNIGQCSTRLGEYENAVVHLARAHALFTSLGLTAEALRTERAEAKILVSKGDYRRGTAALREARTKFLSHGLIEEAGLCGLEVVELLLERDDASQAVELSREIVEEFAAAELSHRAVAALQHLHAALEARRASRATVRSIAEYIESLHQNPDEEFVATA
ncbi:MAG TPA: tetratricopeptide repeat protein [Thermoanaerobaculia bacterium]|jgi:tetratricopeptide (TPR) repeat protein